MGYIQERKPEIADYIDQVRDMVPDVIAAGGGWLIAHPKYGDTSLLTQAEVRGFCKSMRGEGPRQQWMDEFYSAATWVEPEELTAALRGPVHITKTADDRFKFDYEAIEAAMRRLGATEEEADAATDILSEEGWGGIEYEMPDGIYARHFTDAELLSKLNIVRERREA